MPSCSRYTLAVFCLLVSISSALRAQPSQKQIEVDKIFAGFNTHTPGCAVGVANKGVIELRAGYGMADLERNVAITPGTVFESGSVAKQFTAAALMLLAQQGKISLDDPMRKYLPELQSPLTIRQVISHISGIREWRPIAMFGGYPEGKYVYTNEDLLQMAAMQKALNFDPGSNYSYSNTGYNISTILIERVTAKSFQQFTHDMIFAPLAMTHTRWRDDFRAVIPNRALAYGPLPKGAGWAQQTPIENIIGAGGLLTTVGDLLLWNENFTHAKVGGADFVKAQQTPATLSNGRTISYAAGLSVGSFETIREVAHSGATGGYRTWLGRYPDHGVSVAVLCNAANANPTALGRATARLWTGSNPPPEAVPVSIADPQKYAGMFRKVRDNTVEIITVKSGGLHFGSAQLKAIGEGKFTLGGSTINFEPSAARFRLLNSTDDVLYERVEPVQPTAADLAAFVGKYTSSETGAVVTVSEGGSKPGELKLRIGGELTIALKPTFKDAFESNAGMAIRFLRDASGKVNGMSAGESRVWDLRFTRLER